MSAALHTQNSPRPRVEAKPPPMGVVGRCSCEGHERVFVANGIVSNRRAGFTPHGIGDGVNSALRGLAP